jgi:hypothetical protein
MTINKNDKQKILIVDYKEIKKKDGTVKAFFLTALSEMRDYVAFKKEVFPNEGERYFIVKPIENEEETE